MKKFTHPLSKIEIAAPCTVDWDQMTGDEQVKFCGQCQLNVYNLSEMTEKQANQLITKTEGRLCVRYYQREDGSVLTQDCPIGLRIRRRAQRIAAVITGTVVSVLSMMGVHAMASETNDKPNPPCERTQGQAKMGDVAVPPKNTDTRPPEATMGIVNMQQTPPPSPPPKHPMMGKIAPPPIPHPKR